MAETTANVKVQIEGEDVEALAGALDDLSKSLAKITAGFKTTEEKAKQTNGAIDNISKQANNAAGGFSKFAKASLEVAAGLATFEIAKKIAETAINGIKASMQAYLETNKEAKDQLGGLNVAFTDLKTSLGEAMLGGDNASKIFGTFERILDTVKKVVDENKERIQELIMKGFEKLIPIIAGSVRVFGVLMNTLLVFKGVLDTQIFQLKSVGNAFQWVGAKLVEYFIEPIKMALVELANFSKDLGIIASILGAEDLAGLFRQISTDIEGMGGSIQDFADNGADRAIQNQTEALQEYQQSMSNTANMMQEVDQISGEIADTISGLAGSLDGAAVSTERVNRSLTGTRTAAQEAAIALEKLRFASSESLRIKQEEYAALVAAQEEHQRIIQGKEDAVEQSRAAAKAAQRTAELEAIEQANEREREAMEARLALYDESRLRLFDVIRFRNDQEIISEEEKVATIKSLQAAATNTAIGAFSSVQSIISAGEKKSGKERKEAQKKALGGELKQFGSKLIIQGLANAIALNPVMAAAQIAGGTFALAAGSKLAGGGGGDGTSKAPTTTTATPSQPVPQSISNNVQNVNFGFVGDPRAAARQMDEINQRGRGIGL